MARQPRLKTPRPPRVDNSQPDDTTYDFEEDSQEESWLVVPSPSPGAGGISLNRYLS